ncbi:MAG: hypothetical protein AAB849_00355 [Patescibacteria group bacterium]
MPPRKKSAAPRAKKNKEAAVLEDVFPVRVDSAEEVSAPEEGFNPSPRFYRIIATAFLAATLLLVIFVVFLTGGKATIFLKLKPQTVKANTNLAVVEKPSAGQAGGLVLGTVIKGEKNFSPSGGTEIPAAATGEVVLYNKTNSSQPLVATTRLLSSEGMLFRLKKSATVPAGGQIKAEVYADKPGKEGEIGPTKFIIPGLSEIKQKDIYAESKTKMSGGVRHISALSEADLKSAEEALVADLYSAGQGKLVNMAKTSSSVYAAGLFTYVKNSVKTDAKIGAVSDSFKMTGEIQVVGVFYNPADLRDILLKQVEENLSAGEQLSGSSVAPSIQINKYDLSAGTADLRVAQEFLVKAAYSDDLLDKNKLLGQPKDAAIEYLRNFSWVDDAGVTTKPAWSKKLPREASKIEIKVSE